MIVLKPTSITEVHDLQPTVKAPLLIQILSTYLLSLHLHFGTITTNFLFSLSPNYHL